MSTVTIEKKMTTMTIETSLEEEPSKKTDSSPEHSGDNQENDYTKTDKVPEAQTNGKSTESHKKQEENGQVSENGTAAKKEETEEDQVEVDQAILTNFLPDDVFECVLGEKCLVGDKTATEGNKKMEYKARQWHEKCFCCVVCKTPIGTKSFIPREQEIYCTTCYEEKFATRCIKCNKIITSGGVTYKNEPWHRECFTCTNCDASLAGQRFTSRDDKPYCAECFGDLFAKRCTACTKPITGIGGTRFISFEDRHWHNDCFICAMCQGSLVGKGFITDGSDILCPECAKQKLM